MIYFWSLFFIGWIFVLVTRLWLNKMVKDENNVLNKPSLIRFIIVTLMCICITLVGGIANGLWLGNLYGNAKEDMPFWCGILLIPCYEIAPACLTYLVGYCVLGLYHIKNKLIHTIFVVVFVASVVCWTIPIAQYQKNIDVEEQTSVSNTVEYDLYYFCNIPVQEISGNIEGSTFFGTGEVSGEISTSDKLPYWYDNGNGDALYNDVNADDSKLVFIEDGETPCVRIVTYCTQKVQFDNNTGKQSVLEENEWTIYEFHVPKDIMQYNIG